MKIRHTLYLQTSKILEPGSEKKGFKHLDALFASRTPWLWIFSHHKLSPEIRILGVND